VKAIAACSIFFFINSSCCVKEPLLQQGGN